MSSLRRIVLLGAPGAGKGTQAMFMSQTYRLPQISTGDILRREISKESIVGLKAQEFITKGLLVPDDVVVEIVKNRLKERDCASGYILDGFPRTLPQAKAMESNDIFVDYVLLIDSEDDVILQRLSGRRVCSTCNRMYHVQLKPPVKESICDACGGGLIKRKDDEQSTIKKRIAVFRNQTAPLIEHYEKHSDSTFIRIDGGSTEEETPEVIFERIKAAFDGEIS